MSSAHRLQHHLDGFHRARVLCVGDLMLDRFVYGTVDRVSAEAPIPILAVTSEEAMLGGVGNVGRNVVALGAQAIVVAVTGDDLAARQVSELAERERGLTPRFVVEADRPTTVKTRFVGDAQQLLRIDEETTDPIHDDTARRVIEAVKSELERADVLVVSDYTKGVLTDDVLRALIDAARAADVPVMTDPKRTDISVYAGSNVLKPNQGELAAAARQPCETAEEVVAAARAMMEAHRIDAVMVSRDERGMILVQRDAEALHLQARAPEVFDVSGAGDTAVATAAVALASGADLVDAAELANVAGGFVVGKVGTASVSRDELASALLALDVSSSEAKVRTGDAALATVESWRKQGKKVGFTNGCFDLLHPGHVSLLTEAKAACDRLIVATNDDKSVQRLKGPDRPVQNETARAIVLASLSVVDMVIVFSEDTPIPLLERLQPDVLIKGGDYTIDEVVGADVVREYGGEVRLATLVPGQSSSRVIEKMTRRDGE